jgi:hypothetical protein
MKLGLLITVARQIGHECDLPREIYLTKSFINDILSLPSQILRQDL